MDIETALRELVGNELETEIEAKIRSFHGLLTREAAMRLIAKEKGILKEEEKKYSLTDIPKDAKKFGFSAHVKKIWPTARYSSGKCSRVIEVADEDGTMPLVLWNDDVDLAKGLRSKDEIMVRGAYERAGELHLGYSGSVVVLNKAAFSRLDSLQDGEEVHLTGVISKIEGYDSFIRNGRSYRGFSLFISDGMGERRCVFLGGVDRAKKLKEGDDILIENAVVSNGNVDIVEATRILSRRKSDMLLGQLRKLECVGETLVVDVEGKELRLDRTNALHFLGVAVAEDITLSTVTTLKKEKLLNNRIAVRIEEKNGQILIK